MLCRSVVGPHQDLATGPDGRDDLRALRQADVASGVGRARRPVGQAFLA
jgi:hypothetical protein